MSRPSRQPPEATANSVAVPSAPSADHDDRDDHAITAALAAGLVATPLRPGRGALLRHAVMQRVQQSAQAHRSLVTVRREDSPWVTAAPGVKHRSIGAAGGVRTDLLTLEPQASLPWLADAHAQELLIVDGSLTAPRPGSASFEWTRLQHTLRSRDTSAAAPVSAGPRGATVYLRSVVGAMDHLPPGEARWWSSGLAAAARPTATACPWSRWQDGVDAALLQGDGDVVSMLIRMEPGATLPDHGHSLDEDCLMLEGHMFLGDILMRAGDYQRAPVGFEHVGISSDTGGVFYFHGALPPAASVVAP